MRFMSRRLNSTSPENSESGVATTMEYIVLLIISATVFVSLLMAFSTGATTARNDAAALAAQSMAYKVSAKLCDLVGDGSASASMPLDLPEDICGQPYLIYPSDDGRHVIVRVDFVGVSEEYGSPLTLRKDGVRIAGFIESGPGVHRIAYDARDGTVTIS